MRTIRFRQFGEPAEVLAVEDGEIPEPGPGEVRVRMLASPVNPSDLMTVRGEYGQRPALPATPGYEGVGVVEAGGGVLGWFLRGKRVAAINPSGGNWAEYAVISARQAIPLPRRMPLEHAATFFVNPATAFLLARHVLNVPAGDWLLQTAAASQVGRMIIRLGRRFGFRTINVVRRVEQVADLRNLGADVVVLESDDLREQVREATGDGVRYAIDPVGGKTGSAMVPCLAREGRLIVYGTLSGEPLSIPPRDLIAADARIEGFWLGHWMRRFGLLSKLRLARTLSRLILDGTLASEVGETFPLERIRDAVVEAERQGRSGKVLLTFGVRR